MLKKVAKLRNHYDTFDPLDCPPSPPNDYPKAYPVTDVINNWQPDKVDPRPAKIYQALCIFDYVKDRNQAEVYRKKEKPFIVRNIPDLDDTVLRWNDQDYVKNMFGETLYRAEYSLNNHFMYCSSHSLRPPTTLCKGLGSCRPSPLPTRGVFPLG